MKEEVQNAVMTDQYADNLKSRPDGSWMWDGGGDESGAKATSLDALTYLASQKVEEAIADATPSHNSIKVNRNSWD